MSDNQGYQSAALIDYMGDLSISMMNTSANKQMQRENRAWAEGQSNLQFQRALENRNFMLNYNLPSAQRERLEAAGISPWTAFGQMSGQSSGNINPQQAQGTQVPYRTDTPKMNTLGAYAAMRQMQMQEKAMSEAIKQNELANESQMLQNASMEYYLANVQPYEEGRARSGEHRAEEKHKWEGKEVDERIKEWGREADRHTQAKSLWASDTLGAKLENRLRQANLRKMGLDYNLGTQTMQLNAQELQRGVQQYKKNELEIRGMEWEDFYNIYRKHNITEYGYDVDKNIWNNITPMLGRGYQNIFGKKKKYNKKRKDNPFDEFQYRGR